MQKSLIPKKNVLLQNNSDNDLDVTSSKLSILVVDDDALNLIASSMTVRSFGYAVDEASSGQIALDKIKVRTYAAILMDVQMPNMDGLECSVEIRAMEQGSDHRIPIIAFSSQLESDIKQDCFDAGMDAILEKGCSSAQLATVLKRFILDEPDSPRVAS